MSKVVTVDSIMMTHPQLDVTARKPVTIEEDKTVQEALQMMTEYQIRHLPVTKNRTVVGIISDRDIKWAIAVFGKAKAGVLWGGNKLPVGDICHRNPYTVTPGTPLREVAKTMAEKHYGSAIVMENGQLIGLVTTIDICRYVAEHL